MNNLLLAVANDAVNPEAMVRAAVAAVQASVAAYWAAVLAVLTLGSVLVLGAIIIYIAFQFKDLVRHTNGMREELVQATRKLALIEGNLTGRAELKEEEASLKIEKEKP